MFEVMRRFQAHLPAWMQDWLEFIIPGAQILLIIGAAWLLNRLVRRLIARAGRHYGLPPELLVPLRGVFRWILIAATVPLVLERLGVSATVLWTAFTGFATVGAVAFFAAWSVLSNLFCALLIFTVRPFRIGDHIEVLDTAEKPGALGRVIDINLLYTTLEDATAPHVFAHHHHTRIGPHGVGHRRRILAHACARERPQQGRTRARAAVTEDKTICGLHRFDQSADLRMTESGVGDRNGEIGDSQISGRCFDLLAGHLIGALTLGPVVDDESDA